MCVFVSQSGETADTMAALRLAKEKGCTTIAVANVLGSSISREADHTIYTCAGPEIAVASTKAYTTQLIVLLLLSLLLSSLFCKSPSSVTSSDVVFPIFIIDLIEAPQSIYNITANINIAANEATPNILSHLNDVLFLLFIFISPIHTLSIFLEYKRIVK